MSAARSRLADGAVSVALLAVGLLVAVLLYGLVTRLATPRTTPTRETAAAPAAEPVLDPIQVEVRNAAAVDGLARTTTAYLRRRGFDVVTLGNAATLRQSSSVVVRAGTDAYAERVGAALGLGTDRVERGDAAADYDPDVVVYLGADYASLSPFSDPD